MVISKKLIFFLDFYFRKIKRIVSLGYDNRNIRRLFCIYLKKQNNIKNRFSQ